MSKNKIPQNPKNYIKFNSNVVKPPKKKWQLSHIIVFVLMVLWTVGFGLSVFLTAKDCNSNISASAEESLSSVADSVIDSTHYASANLFNPSNLPSSGWNGRLVRDGYSFTAYKNTYGSTLSGCTFAIMFPDIEAGVPYTFSCNVTSNYDPVSAQFTFGFLSGKYLIPMGVTGYVSKTLVFNEAELQERVYFYGGKNSSADDFFVKWENLTCNRGEVAYPFMPNLDDIYQSGVDSLYYGYWYNALVSSEMLYDGFVIPFNDTVSYVDNGIGLNNVYNYYSSEGLIDFFNYLQLDIVFDKKFRASEWSVKSNGSVEAMDTGIVLIVRTYFDSSPSTPQVTYRVPLTFQFISDNVYDVVADWSFLPKNANLDKYYIWSIEGLKFVSKEQLLSFSLFSENTQFVSGYNAGYNTGFNEGLMSNDSYTVGYDDGYNLGYSVGNRSGYIEGLQGAENSNFYQLITAVIDVPLNAFVSMFNFDVLGINMANFFLSLFTLCVVLTVVRMLI